MPEPKPPLLPPTFRDGTYRRTNGAPVIVGSPATLAAAGWQEVGGESYIVLTAPAYDDLMRKVTARAVESRDAQWREELIPALLARSEGNTADLAAKLETLRATVAATVHKEIIRDASGLAVRIEETRRAP